MLDMTLRETVLREALDKKPLYRQAGRHLIAEGCCSRCALRALNIREHRTYVLPVKTIDALLNEGQAAEVSSVASPSDLPCVLCLGSLQNADKEGEGFAAAAQQIKNENYELYDFSMGIQVPLSFLVRHKGLEVFMKENYSELGSTMVDMKEALKWVGGALLCEYLLIDYKHMSDFQINLVYTHPETDSDHHFLREIPESGYQDPVPTRFQRQRKEVVIAGASTVLTALGAISNEQYKSHWKCPSSPVTTYCPTPAVHLEHASIFFAGRYRKFSRTLSQTPWILDGVRKTENSVQEYIDIPIKAVVRPLEVKFNSSGREDCDVRMLGPGRPFALECIDPHRIGFTKAEVKALEQQINSSTTDIEVVDLQLVTRKDTIALRDGGETKTKTYTAVVWYDRPITAAEIETFNNTKEVILNQKTPLRVLHRRSLATRQRAIHSMRLEPISPHFAAMILTTQAGTYIKEFVHGDMGRTLPNVGTLLGCKADILQLDVTDIDLDWPAKVVPE
eukprot:Ihof_evm8s84 gene=Ihof_evmTU8s84